MTQNVIGLFILIIVGLILWPLAPRPNPNVSGIFLPNAPLKTPTSPNQVQVLQVMPPNAQILGIINTKLHYNTLALSEENQDIALSLNYAKALAGQAGASAIVVNTIGSTLDQGPLDGIIVEANAVSY